MTAFELLAKHQWSGTAYGNYGTAPRCPECDGIRPGCSLNNGGGSYEMGKGHRDGCAIAAVLAAGETDAEFWQRRAERFEMAVLFLREKLDAGQMSLLAYRCRTTDGPCVCGCHTGTEVMG